MCVCVCGSDGEQQQQSVVFIFLEEREYVCEQSRGNVCCTSCKRWTSWIEGESGGVQGGSVAEPCEGDE